MLGDRDSERALRAAVARSRLGPVTRRLRWIQEERAWWQTPEQTEERGGGNCLDLALRLLAWLAPLVPVWLCLVRTGPDTVHAFLRFTDESVLDPSVLGGMPALRWGYPKGEGQETRMLMTRSMFNQEDKAAGDPPCSCQLGAQGSAPTGAPTGNPGIVPPGVTANAPALWEQLRGLLARHGGLQEAFNRAGEVVHTIAPDFSNVPALTAANPALRDAFELAGQLYLQERNSGGAAVITIPVPPELGGDIDDEAPPDEIMADEIMAGAPELASLVDQQDADAGPKVQEYDEAADGADGASDEFDELADAMRGQ